MHQKILMVQQSHVASITIQQGGGGGNNAGAASMQGIPMPPMSQVSFASIVGLFCLYSRSLLPL